MYLKTISLLCLLLACLHMQIQGGCINHDIRLVDGQTPNEGRVEYCYNGDWGTICHHFWDHKAAEVVCRQLGLPTEFPTALLNYRGGCGVILLDYVVCAGSEERLSTCSHDGFYSVEGCSHSTDVGARCLAGPDCNHGELRLHGDRGPNEGRVEICFEGVWSIVCGYEWDYNDALVVCRELGLPTTVVEAIDGYDAKGPDVYVLGVVQCSGNESTLFDCPHSQLAHSDCVDSHVAGVKCLNEPQCNDTDVRIVGGYIPTVGRVEVCHSGTWGTVCRDENEDWTYQDATVVCRQLGHPSDWAWAIPEIGLGSGHIVYTDVACEGNEETLSDCEKSDEITSEWCFSHEHDAGIICLDDYECTNGNIRLVSGPSVSAGRVESCEYFVWRAICSNEWDMNEAFVACKELGYHTGYSMSLPIEEGELTHVWKGSMQCNGTEHRLEDCGRQFFDNYLCRTGGYEYAGVKCFTEPECENGSVRMVQTNDEESSFSAVQLCIHGFWAFIGGNFWDDTDASVVCRELGFLSFNATAGVHMSYSSSPPVLVDEVQCTKSDTRLRDCNYTKTGFDSTCRDYHGEATVSCFMKECNGTEVRLRDGTSEYDGSVEVCSEGVWVTVCDDDTWDLYDATVVCSQLGYSSGPSYPLNLYAGDESRTGSSHASQSLHIDSVQCTGSEERLDLCSLSKIDATSCPSNYEAGVLCTAPVCAEGSIRVLGSYSPMEGRVEYCYNAEWHSVCSDTWNHSHATVVCSSLGYSTQHESILFDYFGKGQSPILPHIIHCSGSESHLTECVRTPSNRQPQLCGQVAGVICEAPCLSSGVVDCAECNSTHPCPTPSPLPHCQCTSACFSHGSCCSDMATIPNCLESSLEECTGGDVRLTGGVANSSSGRVEVCVGGVWGSVCDRVGNWYLSPHNAATVCRQLGLPIEGSRAVNTSLFGGGTGPVFLSSVQCVGTEDDLLSCLHAGIGNHRCGEGLEAHNYDVGVFCADDCMDGEVRLRDGTSESNGRVEVCVDGVWGHVCSDQWDNVDASVVCSQLGFNSHGSLALNEVFGAGEGGPVFLSEVQCTGSESHITLCLSAGLGEQSCTLERSAGVFCDTRGNVTRCLDESGKPPETQSNVQDMDRFGVCEPYSGDLAECNEILTPALDYVFIPRARGTQEHVVSLLQSSLPDLTITEAGDYCREQIYRIVCNYYLNPCGSEEDEYPPLSICSEQCVIVKETCHSAWEAVRLAMAGSDLPFIDCNDTSVSPIPLPNCCTGVGITEQEPTQDEEVTREQKSGQTIGIVVGISSGCITTVIGGAVLCVVYRLRRRKKDYTQQMQSGILQIGRGGTIHITTNPLMNTEETVFDGEAQAVSNLYNKVNGLGQKGRAPKSPYLRALSRQMIIKHEQLTLLQHIGQGEFGIVYKAKLARHTRNTLRGTSESVVAVKTLKGYFDQSEIDKIMEESLKMKRFEHRHVMGLVGVCLDAGPAPYIIMPYMANGSLHSYLKKERKSLVLREDANADTIEDVCKRLTVMSSQIADGMSYLASEKFVHRDLATRNCMIDLNFVIKITDFGLSEDVYARNYFRQSSSGEAVKLPVKWMAPESLSDGHFSEKSDVWSYGITLWEIFSGGKTPYPAVDPPSLVRLLDRGERMSKPDNAACNQEIYEIMQQCWEYEPENRPPFTELYAKTASYIERMAGYLEMNFTTTNPLLTTDSTDDTIIANMNTDMVATTNTASNDDMDTRLPLSATCMHCLV